MSQKNLPVHELKNDLIHDLEKTGENLKSQMKNQLIKSIVTIDSRVNSAKFEVIYSFAVDKKEREKTMGEVKEVRSDLWTEALRKADGNVNDAYIFYKELCYFS